ncbi:MAG: hypothetical protein NUV76_07290 [Candidatus Kuenenia sp.]|nr:hypothetical protein [Candidatus Kuenenia sp.]
MKSGNSPCVSPYHDYHYYFCGYKGIALTEGKQHKHKYKTDHLLKCYDMGLPDSGAGK